ncbi:ABC transporter permease [Mycoplasma sp. SG1]|uniref:ABC transporter permease n=1 Tax=Mycoplasma sp. SG1 TaxID=2810348 RepID=UPI00202460D0|nr:ABC transporter permease [Mycoplasma sp. SG1]URM53080.1 ABC transporter permease [Mycoplasma sp. SG1]
MKKFTDKSNPKDNINLDIKKGNLPLSENSIAKLEQLNDQISNNHQKKPHRFRFFKTKKPQENFNTTDLEDNFFASDQEKAKDKQKTEFSGLKKESVPLAQYQKNRLTLEKIQQMPWRKRRRLVNYLSLKIFKTNFNPVQRYFHILLIHVKNFFTNPFAFIFPLLMPMIILYTTGQTLSNETSLPPDETNMIWANLISRLLLVSVLSSAFVSVPSVLSINRSRKIYLRYYSSGYSPTFIISIQANLLMIIGIFASVVSLLVGKLAYGQPDVSVLRLFFAILVILVMSIPGYCIGACLASLFKDPRSVQSVGVLVYMLMLYLTGAFTPGTSIPLSLNYISPAWYMSQILIFIMYGGNLSSSLYSSLVIINNSVAVTILTWSSVLIGITILFGIIFVRTFKWL